MNEQELAGKLGKYLEHLIEKPDQELTRPAYLGGREPTKLYIDPYVFPPGSDQQAVELSCGFRPTIFVLDATFMALLCQCLESFSFRRLWIDCWRPVWQNNTPWRCVIVGRPGYGKSLLLVMTARALAQEGKRLLEDPANLPNTPLPLVITARHIADTEPSTNERPTESLHKLIRRTLKDAGVDEETATYIVNRAEDRRTWLMLDGIDEVHPDKLDWIFAAIADWNCRLIVTSRPYSGGVLVQADVCKTRQIRHAVILTSRHFTEYRHSVNLKFRSREVSRRKCHDRRSHSPKQRFDHH